MNDLEQLAAQIGEKVGERLLAEFMNTLHENAKADDIIMTEVVTLRAELAEQKAFGRQLFEEKKRAMELLEAAESESTRLKAEVAEANRHKANMADDLIRMTEERDRWAGSAVRLEELSTRLREREKAARVALEAAIAGLDALRDWGGKYGISAAQLKTLDEAVAPLRRTLAALSAEPEGKEARG